jgi:hypothetical protein
MWNPCLPGVKPVTLPLTSVYPSSHRRASTNREKRWDRTSDGHREYSHTEFERSATGGGVLEEVEGPGDRAVGAAADEGNPFESAGFPCHFSSSAVLCFGLVGSSCLSFRCLSNEPIRPTEKLGCPWGHENGSGPLRKTTESYVSAIQTWDLLCQCPISCGPPLPLHLHRPQRRAPAGYLVSASPPSPIAPQLGRLASPRGRQMTDAVGELGVICAESAVRHAPRRRLRSLAGLHLHAIIFIRTLPFNWKWSCSSFFFFSYVPHLFP